MSRTVDLAHGLGPELVALRRRLHRHPEVGLDLPVTSAAVLDALAGLDLEVTTGRSLTSVVAVLRGRAPAAGSRPVVLLRADMDALPVTEEVALDHVSERPGLMHACGHDLHVAGLVGVRGSPGSAMARRLTMSVMACASARSVRRNFNRAGVA